jgi:hypothetical protein
MKRMLELNININQKISYCFIVELILLNLILLIL